MAVLDPFAELIGAWPLGKTSGVCAELPIPTVILHHPLHLAQERSDATIRLRRGLHRTTFHKRRNPGHFKLGRQVQISVLPEDFEGLLAHMPATTGFDVHPLQSKPLSAAQIV